MFRDNARQGDFWGRMGGEGSCRSRLEFPSPVYGRGQGEGVFVLCRHFVDTQINEKRFRTRRRQEPSPPVSKLSILQRAVSKIRIPETPIKELAVEEKPGYESLYCLFSL